MIQPPLSNADEAMPSQHQYLQQSKIKSTSELEAALEPYSSSSNKRTSTSTTFIPPSRVPLAVRVRLISALAPIQNADCDEADQRKAQQDAMTAYKLAVDHGDMALASRCSFYVAYAFATMAETSTAHRNVALNFLSRATEASKHDFLEGDWARQALQEVSENAQPFDSRTSTSASLIDLLRRFAGSTAGGSSPQVMLHESYPFTGGSAETSSTTKSLSRSTSEHGQSNDQELRTIPVTTAVSSSSTDAVAIHNTVSPRNLCKPDTPTPEFLATVAALQRQQQAHTDNQNGSTNSSTSKPDEKNDPIHQISAKALGPPYVETPNGLSDHHPDGDKAAEKDASHLRSLSETLTSNPKRRSQEARMEEGKSPTQLTFHNSDSV